MAANLDLTGWLGSKERPADINLNSDLQWLQVFTCMLPLPAYRPGRFWAPNSAALEMYLHGR